MLMNFEPPPSRIKSTTYLVDNHGFCIIIESPLRNLQHRTDTNMQSDIEQKSGAMDEVETVKSPGAVTGREALRPQPSNDPNDPLVSVVMGTQHLNIH